MPIAGDNDRCSTGQGSVDELVIVRILTDPSGSTYDRHPFGVRVEQVHDRGNFLHGDAELGDERVAELREDGLRND